MKTHNDMTNEIWMFWIFERGEQPFSRMAASRRRVKMNVNDPEGFKKLVRDVMEKNAAVGEFVRRLRFLTQGQTHKCTFS